MFNAPYSLHLPSLWNEKGRGTELYILSRESEKTRVRRRRRELPWKERWRWRVVSPGNKPTNRIFWNTRSLLNARSWGLTPALNMVLTNNEIVCAFPKGKPNQTKMKK